MKKSWNKGFILMESLAALALITFCVGVFLTGQGQMLQQSEGKMADLKAKRVLYEEVNEFVHYGGSKKRISTQDRGYQVSIIQEAEIQQVAVHVGPQEVVIKIED